MVRRTSVFWTVVGLFHSANATDATAIRASAAATPANLPSRELAGVAFPDSGALAIHSNSAFKSLALCHRSSGSFARQRCSKRSSAGGATSAIDGAGRSMIAAITLAGDEPSNARLPVSISYSTKPNEKMSLRGPASCPVTCSGDMYWNVPSISPLPVSAMVMVPSPAWIAGPAP